MNLKFLETFIWVAKLHSFSLAADKLHSTQAAISSRISVLEQELGAKLFTRDPKGVTLTREGERVLQHAEQVSESMTRLRASLQDENFAPGTVRIGAMDSAIHSWFIDFVSAVTRQYPALDIEVFSETALHLNEQLRRGMLDIVFQTDMLRDETLRSASLLELPIGWVAASSQVVSAGGATSTAALRQLVEKRLITFSRHSRPHQDLLRLLQAHGISEAKVSCVNSVAAMIKLTQGGFGVAAMPPALVSDLLRQGHLQLLEGFDTPPPMPFVAAWRVGSERTERLVDIARQTAHDYLSAVGDEFGRAGG
ncbi:LysR family transcriptional regulator [Paraburkholderia sediminicola]|uniref:LysR family transcriptional regulator n=1 Tax=Paraburkholderia sediminicola TaxID=458836 RepID=UPI0038BCE47B